MPYRLIKLTDDSFMFRAIAYKDGEKLENFRIVRLDVEFDSYHLHIELDRFQQKQNYINSFSYDYQANILILLHVVKEANVSKRKLSLYNLDTDQTVFFQQIQNDNLIGRIKTQIY